MGEHRKPDERRTPHLIIAVVYAALIVMCAWGMIWGLTTALDSGTSDSPTPEPMLTNEPAPTATVTQIRLVPGPTHWPATPKPSPAATVTTTTTATATPAIRAAEVVPGPTVYRTRYVRVPVPGPTVTETSYVTPEPEGNDDQWHQRP